MSGTETVSGKLTGSAATWCRVTALVGAVGQGAGLRHSGQMSVSVCSRSGTNQYQLKSECPRFQGNPALQALGQLSLLVLAWH